MQQSTSLRTPRPYKFTAKFVEFSLQDFDQVFREMPDIDDRMKTGFNKFLLCLDLYLELLENPTIDESQIKIYGSVTLENGAIVRATNNYHNKPWFSNVSISMNSEESEYYTSDQGVCYGMVIEFIY